MRFVRTALAFGAGTLAVATAAFLVLTREEPAEPLLVAHGEVEVLKYYREVGLVK